MSQSIETKPTIPPDPENMNEDRSNAAFRAIECFAIDFGETDESDSGRPVLDRTDTFLIKQNIADLLCDIAHLCDRQGIVLAGLIDIAASHYTEETDSEGTQFLWAAAGRR